MEESKQSKEAWVAAAVEKYEKPLLHYALRITANAESARDVVQDTFLKLCEADLARVDNHLAAWLYTVCRNRALDIRERETRRMGLPETAPNAPPSPDTASAVVRKDVHARIVTLLKTLPENQQEAFQLKFRDGLTYREIGAIMNISLGSVGNLVTAALNAIRHELRSEMDLPQEV